MSIVQAHRELSAGNLKAAHGFAIAELNGNPDSIAALQALLAIAHRTRHPLKIAQLLNRLNTLVPCASQLFDEALAWHLIESPRWVVAALSRIDAASLDSVQLALSVGRLATQYDLHDQAQASFESAVQIDPHNADTHFELARNRIFGGGFDDAIAALKRTLTLSPHHSQTLHIWSTLPASYWPANFLAQVDSAIASTTDLGQAKKLYEARYRILEQQQQYDAAFQAIQRANSMHVAQLGNQLKPQEEKLGAMLSIFDQFIPTFRTQHDEICPIFILGMPRSGTTLTEQIVSSHSDVVGLGELPQFPALLKRELAYAKRHNQPLNLDRLANSYFEQTEFLRGNARYFVDKMPLNYQLIGFIAATFPSAKIILLNREPIDLCFAQYRQIFADGAHAMDYSYDQSTLAHFYRRYSELMAQWQTRCGDRMFTLQYEQLIKSPEEEIGNVLQHIGLPFDPSCLVFHRSSRAVSTASAGQIRTPLSSEHVARWKKYSPQLAILRLALNGR